MSEEVGGVRSWWWCGRRAGGQDEVLVAVMKSWGAGGSVGGVDEELGSGRRCWRC